MFGPLIRRITRNKGGLGRWLFKEGSNVVRYYNDFIYESALNGEEEVLRRLQPFAITTVLDVGANVGQWATMAGRLLPDSHIHSFELCESTRAALREQLVGNRFHIASCGLGAEEGTVEYRDFGPLNEGNSLISRAHLGGGNQGTIAQTQVMRGDQYLDEQGIAVVDLLKIDVEGAEYPVLSGFSRALAERRIRVIQFEYGYPNGEAGHLMRHFYELLGDHGYCIGKIWSLGVRFADYQTRINNFESGPNFLAVDRREEALIAALRSPH